MELSVSKRWVVVWDKGPRKTKTSIQLPVDIGVVWAEKEADARTETMSRWHFGIGEKFHVENDSRAVFWPTPGGFVNYDKQPKARWRLFFDDGDTDLNGIILKVMEQIHFTVVEDNGDPLWAETAASLVIAALTKEPDNG